MKNILFIGLGKQNIEDHLRAALKNKNTRILAVCDINEDVAEKWGDELGIPYYTDCKKMIDEHAIEADGAVVAVQHSSYFDVVKLLLESGVHVFKEKPIAMNFDEALAMSKIAEDNNVSLTVAAQRRHNKIYQRYAEYASQIGNIFSIHGEYTMNIEDLQNGWRSSLALSGGGAVIDMGYHLIDLIVWYFGVPDRISADLGYHNRAKQSYDVEDSAKIQFSYKVEDRRILGSLLISRIYPQKDEGLAIYGMNGTVKIFKNRIELYDKDRELIESYYIKPNHDDINKQFDDFIESLDDKSSHGNYIHHLESMSFIDSIYLSDRESKTVQPYGQKKYEDILTRKIEKELK